MNHSDLNWITNFIWGIADDVLRDLYVRGKYRDVILPMTVLRRLDAVIEPTKQDVLDMKARLDYASDSIKIGYEISFTRHFYKPQPMRSLEDIRADILALEKETEGLLSEIIGG